MKRADFKRHSPVFYIGKGLIIASLVVTASLGFLLGFFVGKHARPIPETHSLNSGPAQGPQPGFEEKTAGEITTDQLFATIPPDQAQKDQQMHLQQEAGPQKPVPVQKAGGAPPDGRRSFSGAQSDIQMSAGAAGTEKTRVIKPLQDTPQKKDLTAGRETQQAQPASIARKYTVQIGAFKNQSEADALKTRMTQKGYKVFVAPVKTQNNQLLHKVMVGEYKTRKEAEVLSIKLRNSEGLRTFVTFAAQGGSPRHP